MLETAVYAFIGMIRGKFDAALKGANISEAQELYEMISQYESLDDQIKAYKEWKMKNTH